MLIPPRRLRRTAALATAAVAALAAVTVVAPPALADNSSTLTVVGTSDVYDSNLIQAVIKPDFQNAYPQYTLNYVSTGTGAAIAYAEQGNASALVVHAPSLENQFVAGGYSDNNEPGHAFFWGDYILASQQADPAGVSAKNAHDIVGAFQRIASAGKAGKANFVSRGGTPGTTVQEHQIWGLTKGVTLCTVSAANGGGASPSTTTGDCPTNISYPSWYHTTGLTQGPNIQAADTCNFTHGNCYVFTDRGTFKYLQSQNEIPTLHIVTRDNGKNAPGGIAELVNTFHGYAVNPDAFSGSTAAGINEVAAQDFLSFVQSPDEQTAIGNYLNPSDPPFVPDASPVVTASAPTDSVSGLQPVTIAGTIKNVVPGTPQLVGKTVSLYATDDASPAGTLKVATTKTNDAGHYTFTVRPSRSVTYSVQTPQLTQVEYKTINPTFSDILAPGSKIAGSTQVTGTVSIRTATVKNGVLTLTGTVSPKTVDGNGTLTLYANNGSQDVQPVTVGLEQGQTNYTARFSLPSGTYTYDVAYEDSPYISIGYSATRTTKVP